MRSFAGTQITAVSVHLTGLKFCSTREMSLDYGYVKLDHYRRDAVCGKSARPWVAGMTSRAGLGKPPRGHRVGGKQASAPAPPPAPTEGAARPSMWGAWEASPWETWGAGVWGLMEQQCVH